LRLFAASCLSIMTVFIKLAGEHGISTPEMIFWRQAFAVPVVLIFIAATTGVSSLRTKRLRVHASRTVIGLVTMSLTFSSYLLMPLAEATTLGFTVPIFATILSALLLREPPGVHRWGAVIAGFVGVLIVVQPGSGQIPPLGAIIGLSSALLIGCTSLLIRQMSRTEPPATIAFYFSALSVPLLAPLLLWFGQNHDVTGWMLMIAIGTIGGMGQIALTAALRWAPVSVVIGMDYVALLWSTLFGWLIWDHLPSVATWIGAPVIVMSGLYIAWRERRLKREPLSEIMP
jgi:drug/metabolite transporter (DMT)-like permease